MAFKLEEMINANQKDYSRAYTFYFVPPAGWMTENDKYLVKSSTLPGDVITPTEANWQGNKYKVATTHEYTDLTVSFLIDPQDDLRKRLADWANAIHDRIDNTHGAPGAYMKDFYLEHIDHYSGSIIMNYKFKMGWPSNIGDVTIDYGSKELATMDVVFTYQWFEIV